jgi:anaerobic dimethyl sulfoxide reductase subunit C (anchor subunit)
MAGHEWSLVLFTVVMQMAVGAFVVLGGMHWFAQKWYGPEQADRLSDRALVAIGPAVVFALLATLFHLGNPLNGPRAMVNIATSWLSREILLALVFSGGGAVFAFMQWRKLATPPARNLLALVVAAVGIVLVLAMSMVYRLPTVPAWNTGATTLTFLVTTFLLGGMAMGCALVGNYWYLRTNPGAGSGDPGFAMLVISLRWIALISVGLLGVQFIVIPVYLAQLANHPAPAAAASLVLLGQQNGATLILRLFLLFAGAGLLSLVAFAMAEGASGVRVMGTTALIAFTAVFVSEVLGRYLFYASMVRIGL